MAKAKTKTYYVLDLDFREEVVEATSVKMTATLISFFRDETLVLVIPVSHMRRVGETKYKTYDELEAEKNEESPSLKAARIALKRVQERNKETSPELLDEPVSTSSASTWKIQPHYASHIRSG